MSHPHWAQPCAVCLCHGNDPAWLGREHVQRVSCVPSMASPDDVLRTSIAAARGGGGDAGAGLEGVSAQIPTICGLCLLPVLCLCPGSLVKVQCCLCPQTMARSKDRVLFSFSSL